MWLGTWKNATITIATDDDLSAEVDLGNDYETLLVNIPALTSSNLTCYVSETSGGTFYPVGNAVVATAGIGSYADIWDIGGHRYIKIGTSAGQAANRTFRVRGVRC